MTTHPPYTPAEERTRETFLALMWALSYPGRVYTLPEGEPPYHLIGETLLDLETSVYTPDLALAGVLTRHGARQLPPETAAYHFYPTLTADACEPVRAASIGTLLYPDRAATLIIGADLSAETGEPFTLTGAGINGEMTVHINGVHPDLWALRESRRRYPLGWDMFLIDGRRVMGLPRSTTITRG